MGGSSLDVVEARVQDIACLRESTESKEILPGRLAALRAYTLLFAGDMHGAVQECTAALERLSETDQFLRGIVAWILSLAQLADVGLQAGSQALEEVAKRGQEIGNPMIAVTALCHQSRLQARQGRLHQAKEILERALRLATGPDGRLPIASEPLIGLGELWREWNDLEAAEAHLLEGIDLAGQWSALAAFDAYGPLARVRQAKGDDMGAREAIEMAARLAQKSESTELDDLISDIQKALFFVRQGDDDWALRWAERRGLLIDGVVSPPPTPGEDHVGYRLRKYEELVLARLFLNQGRSEDSLALLESVLAVARDLGRVDLVIQCQILLALTHQALGNEAQSLDALADALSLAEPGGFVRVFCDEGRPLVSLLRLAASRGISSAYAASLLAVIASGGSEPLESSRSEDRVQPLLEPLSERELDVLRLLATGLSNPEIAQELYIATSTVRSHCKSIYGKLDVHSRWDAVHRAKDLGLI
jgi:LuxR family maltose regulon positive regulatory protein